MSTEINKAFVQQFSSNLIHLINQEGSMLKSKVRNQQCTGKYDHFDRLGRGVVVQRTSRHQDTPQNDVAHSRRRVILDDYIWADLIDQPDKVRMLVDPTSDYAKAAGYDMGIKVDQIIIAALDGSAYSIDSADSSSTVSLPSTQIVDEDFNTANSNLIFEKLVEARRLLLKHAGAIRGDATMVVNASAVCSLLKETETTSSDYNSVKALVNGEINSFMGFNFVTVKDGILLGTADGTDTAPVKCYAFLQRSCGLSIGEDVKVRISERDDKNYSTQVHASMSIGAARIEEEGVVRIECVQAA